jgi:hypothetical protein
MGEPVLKESSYAQLLEEVPNLTEAVRRCYLLAGVSQEEAAWRVGIKYGHFVRMMRPHDSSNYPPDKIDLMMEKMGNNFPLDWQAHRRGLVCYPLEFMRILDGIRDALRAEGRPVAFASLLEALEGGLRGRG